MTQKKMILYVDDDDDDLDLLKEAFKIYEDFELVHVSNGQKALNLLSSLATKEASYLPALVIMDINMPILDGRKTLIQMKRHELFKEIPVVLYSTSGSELDALFAQKWGVRFYSKPRHYKGITEVVHQWVNEL